MSEQLARSRSGEAAPTTARVPGRAQLLVLLAASCLSVLGAVLIAPVLPQMEAMDTAADVLVPVVLTVPALVIGLTAPFAGIIADRVDRKRLLLVGLLLYSVVGTAPLYLPSLQAILISRVLVGVCEAAIMTSATTLIGDYWSGPQRSRYLSLQTLVASLSATVFLALGGASGTQGLRTPFSVYGIALVLVPLAAKLIWQPGGHRAAGERLTPLPWRSLLTPYLVTFVGGIVFYALMPTGFGTGMLLPTLLTWAVNRLDFAQRGRGTGVWTGALFVGQFICPLLIAAIGAGVGGLQPSIGVLGIIAVVMAVTCALVIRRNNTPLDITNDRSTDQRAGFPEGRGQGWAGAAGGGRGAAAARRP
ncbi:hypothetical protein Asi02nite_75650 [Asanoa siamensis]|uniref:Major facilitator superfamily (MFS) profile domain-containing protein n=2 Tax=Asanoa siamensis TaxID=926357 RepID=A0ABQ4D3D4_9ACTN|nr:hypothetical protein Asi02nite_75650 [Asanoa siamensis]